MIPFVLALGMVIIIIFLGFGFLGWVWHEHRLANKYRYLIELHKRIPAEELRGAYNKGSAAPRWRITYRAKGKDATDTIEAESEAIAIREFTRSKSIGYGKIVKCERC